MDHLSTKLYVQHLTPGCGYEYLIVDTCYAEEQAGIISDVVVRNLGWELVTACQTEVTVQIDANTYSKELGGMRTIFKRTHR